MAPEGGETQSQAGLWARFWAWVTPERICPVEVLVAISCGTANPSPTQEGLPGPWGER